jgi:molecular chaperone GrpE (heat shock protein)
MPTLEKSAEFIIVEKEYKENRTLLDQWKVTFQDLSEKVESLSADFENQYNGMTIDENIPLELKEKLENRLDGIRLSNKTASRLKRKLNIEKPIEENTPEFIMWEELQGYKGRVLDSEDSEPSNETEQSTEITMESVEQVLKSNEATNDCLKSSVEAAEKRFVSFFEKVLAPVMDGLYSGNVYAEDLLTEVNVSFSEHSNYVKEWLTVYTDLMSKINNLLEQFSVGLLIPEKGQFFNELEHEPLVVVEDPSMETEQIKEIIRYGYYYKGIIYKQERFLIRPAQVSVVKNKDIPVEIVNNADADHDDQESVEQASDLVDTVLENKGEDKNEN